MILEIKGKSHIHTPCSQALTGPINMLGRRLCCCLHPTTCVVRILDSQFLFPSHGPTHLPTKMIAAVIKNQQLNTKLKHFRHLCVKTGRHNEESQLSASSWGVLLAVCVCVHFKSSWCANLKLLLPYMLGVLPMPLHPRKIVGVFVSVSCSSNPPLAAVLSAHLHCFVFLPKVSLKCAL